MSLNHLEKAVRTQEGMYRRHVRQIKQRTFAELRKAPSLLATGQRYCTEALCHTCAFECCCCCSSWFWSYRFHYICQKYPLSSRGPQDPRPLTRVPMAMKTSSHRRTRVWSWDPTEITQLIWKQFKIEGPKKQADYHPRAAVDRWWLLGQRQRLIFNTFFH